MADQRPPDGEDCTCGGTIAAGRRDGFCSSWCAARDAQSLPPQSPPPRFSSGSSASGTREPVETPHAILAGTVPSVVDAGRPVTSAPAEDEPKRPSYRQRRRKIADEIEDRLRQADMLDTWQAAQVLDLADALDWQGGALSARAAAHRELERQMSEILRGQDDPATRVGGMRSELDERRERRARQAGAVS